MDLYPNIINIMDNDLDPEQSESESLTFRIAPDKEPGDTIHTVWRIETYQNGEMISSTTIKM